MSRVNDPTSTPTTTTGTSTSTTKGTSQFGDLEVEDFLQLMIAELSNQDPLSPMSNEDLVAQINQIREIGATDKLTSTLDAVLTSSNLTSASSMIGKQVNALSDEAVDITGTVERVTVEVNEETEERTYRLQVRDENDVEHAVKLKNIREVLSQ